MVSPEQNDPLELLSDLTGEQALWLAQILNRLADAIWRTYAADIDLVRAEREGSCPLDYVHAPSDVVDDEFPF